MSLNAIINTGTSGLMTAQTQLRVVSDNVANVNTPGYVRKVAEQQSVTSQGMGMGVEVTRIKLATDRFLQAASLNSGSDAARFGVRHELFERVQSLFGDPGASTGFFNQIDAMFAAFAAAAEDSVSGPRRQDALFRVQSLFDESARITGQINAVREDADGRIKSAVEKANNLLAHIEALNVEISRASILQQDASGAESKQSALIEQLSQLMDIRVSVRAVGGVSIRTGSGLMLAGDGHATLDYARAGAINSESSFDEIWITEPRGVKRSLADHLNSGEIRGLLEVRDREAPAALERLSELMTRIADELNRAHNANSAVPAPNALTGRNVGQSLESALTGFTGTTTIAVTNASGVIVTQAEIVFAGGTLSINGAPSSPASFLADLNAQLGGQAVASFSQGRLSISAAAGTNGIAIADDPASPSSKTGRGFSHFFGLNDLISTDRPAIYETGLGLASAHGFTPGESITFRFTDENGAKLRDINVTVPPGASMADLIDRLNDQAEGVGRFGQFSLDANGALSFTAFAQPGPGLGVLEDTTTQVPSGVSLTELFGIGGGVRASRGDGFSIRTDIAHNPSRLALAQLNLSAAPGAQALSSGDGRGALALADAGQVASRFANAGGAVGGDISISRYASELAGEIGGKAASARDRQQASLALYTEARARQTAFEGVNLDEELVLMTVYQQAFNASARLIQAASDMYDTLLGMLR